MSACRSCSAGGDFQDVLSVLVSFTKHAPNSLGLSVLGERGGTGEIAIAFGTLQLLIVCDMSGRFEMLDKTGLAREALSI